jgi:hypothetical protein
MSQPMNNPTAVSTNGTVKAIFLASMSSVLLPKLTEVNAVTALDFSCYATGDGFAAETSQANIEDARLCQKAVNEAPGDITDTLEITYVFNPKVPLENEAHLELVQGRKGFILVRWAVDSEIVMTIGDFVDVYPVTLGAQRKNNPTRNAVHKISQKCFVTGPVQREKVMAA